MLAITAVIAGLYFGQQAFIPIALAILVALLLSGIVETLHRYRVPRMVGATLILSVLIAGVGAAINAVWEPAQEWLASAPNTLMIIERKLRPLESFVRRIDSVTARAGKLASPTQQGAAPATPSTSRTSVSVLAETRDIAVTAATVVILALLLLIGGAPMAARMCAAFVSESRVSEALSTIGAVRKRVARYYGTIALINLGLGIATSLAMTLLKMPNPLLWGVMAAVLNFIPYAGSATTLAVLTIVAFVTFDNVAQILAVFASYLALATIEGQIVQPLLLGRRLELNPVLVFLALWFGGWIWGIAGIVLAVPSLVALKVAAENSSRGATLAAFLSPGESGALKLRDRLVRTKPGADHVAVENRNE